ncbi:MAG: sigma-54 dependent transcriptional regulator [Desulfobacterales bacterium]|nr:sigma-54 dependent transcriptional regulator [Desulfobacterales bacterium]
MKSVLVVSKLSDVQQSIQQALEADFRVEKKSSLKEGSELLRQSTKDFVFVDLDELKLSQDNNDYKQGLELIWNTGRSTAIIVISPQKYIREAVRAVKAGASDYITYPIDLAEVKHVVGNINDYFKMKSELDYLRDQFWETDSLEVVRTENVEMKNVFGKIRLVAPTNASVLLVGETGTGKGVLARLIHKHSHRKNNQLISVHCGAMPDTLLESELFGHEKGAFTGAIRRKLGKFEIANGGTIFLDEIATLTPSAQIKLLQVLQEGIFQRVGGEETKKVDVRIISATNVDLKNLCDEGRFRKDLFYRLNAFPIQIPSLSERSEDIPQLIDFFLKKLDRTFRKDIRSIRPEVIKALQKYPWPGNIRELENIIEQAYILGSPDTLTWENFSREIIELGPATAFVQLDTSGSLADIRRTAIQAAEKAYLAELMAKHQGKINRVSADAGITTRQLHKLLSKYGIRKEKFKSPAAS